MRALAADVAVQNPGTALKPSKESQPVATDTAGPVRPSVVTSRQVQVAVRPPTTFGDPLTPRELEIVGLLALGLSNAEIATRLFIARQTVKSHLKHIGPKLGCNDRAGIVGVAYRWCLLPATALDAERYDTGHRDGWRACATVLGAGLDPSLLELAGP